MACPSAFSGRLRPFFLAFGSVLHCNASQLASGFFAILASLAASLRKPAKIAKTTRQLGRHFRSAPHASQATVNPNTIFNMNFYNLKQNTQTVDFKTATIQGQGQQQGLFFPENIAPFNADFLANLMHLPNDEIAYQCVKDFVGQQIPEQKLRQIVSETIAFDLPIKKINQRIWVLELFHGPTLAFKDIGARFMSRCLSYFLQEQQKKVCVLVATSGDTGGAVANGFYNMPGIDVVILYPKNRVSPVQEQQLTALGKNIHALEIEGSFDDCQAMVKQAFDDESLKENVFITSANSINVARWLPQQIYYALALKQWFSEHKKSPVISVPSGNFGNLAAGMLAHKRGLAVNCFIAACNANDVVYQYLSQNIWEEKPTIATISNAMDVAKPSNFVRILQLFNQDIPNLKQALLADSISDNETKNTIKRVWEENNYVLDPHGAVAFLALEKYLENHPEEKGFFLATAHPVKFPQAVQEATGQNVALPQALADLMQEKSLKIPLKAGYKDLKTYLIKEFGK